MLIIFSFTSPSHGAVSACYAITATISNCIFTPACTPPLLISISVSKNLAVRNQNRTLWFMTARFIETEIDIKRGGVPEVVKIPLEMGAVIAWQPLPEPWKGEVNE